MVITAKISLLTTLKKTLFLQRSLCHYTIVLRPIMIIIVKEAFIVCALSHGIILFAQ